MSRIDFAEKFIFTQLFKFSVFSSVGYLGRYFFMVWDTTEEIFLRCEIHHRTISGYFRTHFLLLYPTKQMLFFPLYPTMEQIFFLCTLEHKRIFCSVFHNAESSVPLSDTAQENDTTQNNIF